MLKSFVLSKKTQFVLNIRNIFNKIVNQRIVLNKPNVLLVLVS